MSYRGPLSEYEKKEREQRLRAALENLFPSGRPTATSDPPTHYSRAPGADWRDQSTSHTNSIPRSIPYCRPASPSVASTPRSRSPAPGRSTNNYWTFSPLQRPPSELGNASGPAAFGPSSHTYPLNSPSNSGSWETYETSSSFTRPGGRTSPSWPSSRDRSYGSSSRPASAYVKPPLHPTPQITTRPDDGSPRPKFFIDNPTLTADLDFFTSRLRLGLDTTQMVDTFVYVALTRMIKADVKMVIDWLTYDFYFQIDDEPISNNWDQSYRLNTHNKNCIKPWDNCKKSIRESFARSKDISYGHQLSRNYDITERLRCRELGQVGFSWPQTVQQWERSSLAAGLALSFDELVTWLTSNFTYTDDRGQVVGWHVVFHLREGKREGERKREGLVLLREKLRPTQRLNAYLVEVFYLSKIGKPQIVAELVEFGALPFQWQ